MEFLKFSKVTTYNLYYQFAFLFTNVFDKTLKFVFCYFFANTDFPTDLPHLRPNTTTHTCLIEYPIDIIIYTNQTAVSTHFFASTDFYTTPYKDLHFCWEVSHKLLCLVQ